MLNLELLLEFDEVVFFPASINGFIELNIHLDIVFADLS
ncbi:hypothetical protein WKT22_00783 [Candidatus Lokiarchaeum ossiferum]